VAATLQLRRHPLAWAWSGVCGVGFVVWIAVQSMVMGSFRHPAQTILQAAVLGIAVLVAVLSLRQYRRWRLGAARDADGH
jgi:4-amino-4-deoxy-L-arabinose transferase-like glycosyltransferase